MPSRFSEALKEGQAGAPRPLSRYATEPGTFGVRAEQRASGSGSLIEVRESTRVVLGDIPQKGHKGV